MSGESEHSGLYYIQITNPRNRARTAGTPSSLKGDERERRHRDLAGQSHVYPLDVLGGMYEAEDPV